MANAIPIRVPGTGGSTLEYVLPANMMQFVQSVNAVINNSGGTVTKPVLTVLDSSNEVIADVPQGRSIPAGGAGRATWALGLGDEQEDPVDPFLPVLSVYARMTGGQSVNNNALGVISFTSVKYNNGGWINLVTDPTLFTVPTTGYYTVWAQYEWNAAAAAGQRREAQINLAGDPFFNGAVARENVPTLNAVPTSQNVSLTRRLVAGSKLTAIVLQSSGGPFTIGSVDFAVSRVWKA